MTIGISALSLIGIVVVLCIILFWGIGIYNSLVSLRNLVKTAFAQVDVQLQRRYDLIPNLVEVAKKYMEHERQTLEAVVAARNSAMQAAQQAAANPTDGVSIKNLNVAEQSLGGVLGRLFALSENYPNLKADTQMSQLMTDLTETENKVSYARQAYNNSVMQYNTATEVFPSALIARMFNFQPADLFKIENEEMRRAPKVQF